MKTIHRRGWGVGEPAMKALMSLALAGTTGCGNCEGRLEVVEGALPVPLGASIQLEYYFDEQVVSSASDCHGFWYVNGIEGGDQTVGTVTSCGLYTAPEAAPAGEIEVMAADYAVGTCADCCPYASLVVGVADGLRGGDGGEASVGRARADGLEGGRLTGTSARRSTRPCLPMAGGRRSNVPDSRPRHRKAPALSSDRG